MFSHRKLKSGKSVRLHAELVQYLMEKADAVNRQKKIKIFETNGKDVNGKQMVYIVKNECKINHKPGVFPVLQKRAQILLILLSFLNVGIPFQ